MAEMKSNLEIDFEKDELLKMFRKQFKLSKESKAQRRYNEYLNIYNNTSGFHFIKKVKYALKARKWRKKLEKRVEASNKLKTKFENKEIEKQKKQDKAVIKARDKANLSFSTTEVGETSDKNKYGCFDFSRPDLEAWVKSGKGKDITNILKVIKQEPMAIATLPPDFLLRSEAIKTAVTNAWKAGMKDCVKKGKKLIDPASGREMSTKEACAVTKAFVSNAIDYGRAKPADVVQRESVKRTNADIDRTF